MRAAVGIATHASPARCWSSVSRRWMLAAVSLVLAFGCAPSEPVEPSCLTWHDCPDGLVCIVGRCARTDASTSMDASIDAESIDAESVDAAAVDASVDASEPPDAALDGATCDCSLAACAGSPCDDGQWCTTDDVCTGGTCRGTLRDCDSECSLGTCDEALDACRAHTPAPDGDLCTDGRCCYGRCSNLFDSGNCGGCGLGCDEETCGATAPARCICVTNAGCPSGQVCVSGSCLCTADSQCAAGQRCLAGGYCSY